MTKVKTNRRDGAALVASAIAHMAIIAILVSQAAPQYVLPEPPPAPPMDVQIMAAPDIPPPPIVPPKMTPRKIETQTPTPPTPARPIPEPKPTPAPPQPPKPAPAKPTPPKAAPVVVVAPAPPKLAPPAPPSPAPAPAKLNIHKPKEDAPANIATLPMAPSPSPASQSAAAAGAQTAGAQAAGSRLNGLTPFPLGSMPSGGTGLRGTLVGCANADSVRLSSVERAHCDERFGVELAHAPPLDGINPAKRAAFDRAAEAQDRSLHAGSIDPMRAMEARHGRPSDFGGGVVTGPASTFVHQ